MSEEIKCVLTDFDGTMTHEEALTPLFFDILFLLKQKKIPFCIVTGRSKSWGHFFLSHFPDVDYVISEGGGNLSGMGDKRLIWDKLLVAREEVQKLEEKTALLLKTFPNIQLSRDSFGREADRAVELRELPEDPKLVDEVLSFFDEHEVHYSKSNVHINFWCGEFDKASASEHLLDEYYNLTPKDSVFFGDSMNDEPMFKEFPHTVGVSNISAVLDRLKHKPSTILEGSNNAGPFGVLNYLSSRLK